MAAGSDDGAGSAPAASEGERLPKRASLEAYVLRGRGRPRAGWERQTLSFRDLSSEAATSSALGYKAWECWERRAGGGLSGDVVWMELITSCDSVKWGRLYIVVQRK